MPDPVPSTPGKTAVVLGSSFLGVYAHAGFLNGLVEAGFVPDRVAGASAGALAGALFASGLRGDDLRRAALCHHLRFSFADPGVLWRLPGVLTSFWSSGLFTGKRTVSHLRKLLGETDLDGLPLDIAVTDVASSTPAIRRSGPLAELVMASCAVPGLFTIQDVGDDRYLDGGIAAELPFEHLIDDPAIDTILIHRIRHEPGSGPNVNWETVANVVGIAHHTACNELHRLRADLCRQRGKRLIEHESTTPFPGIFSNRLAPQCYKQGLDSGKSAAARL
jgi:predicted acylesterase/phospholipase RssA